MYYKIHVVHRFNNVVRFYVLHLDGLFSRVGLFQLKVFVSFIEKYGRIGFMTYPVLM